MVTRFDCSYREACGRYAGLVVNMSRIFLAAWWAGNGLATSGLVTAGQAMGQQLQSWQSGGGEKLWLSMLIDTMEEVSRPEIRSQPCDWLILASVYAHLARPASASPHGASSFSLRN